MLVNWSSPPPPPEEVSRHITEVAKSAAAQDWETICSKRDDLSKRFIEAYPDETTDEFPREEEKETFTAARVSSKLKKLRNSFISFLCWNGSILFCPFTLEPNGTVPNGSSVNARAIRTNFGTVPCGTVAFGSSENGVIKCKTLVKLDEYFNEQCSTCTSNDQ